MAAAKYLKQLHEITKEVGKEEPSLNVRMVGYEAKMKLGNRKWTSSVQSTSTKAIIDVAKQALADLQSSLAIIQKNETLMHETIVSNNTKTVDAAQPMS